MPKVLVVDDSAVDRRLIGGLLEDDSVLAVRYAEDGAEALQAIELSPPDLVITDLQMPDIDGMELVSAIKASYPQLPVILTTAHGSEALAVEALQRGAASYVPKSHLADKLIPTIEQVLALSATDRGYGALIDCTHDVELRLTLTNDVALIDPLVDLSQQLVSGLLRCDANSRLRVGVALEEALLNALYRGNLEIGFEELQEARENLVTGGGTSIVDQRRRESPYRDRYIHFHLKASAAEARFSIRDEGPGFDVAALPTGDALHAMEREAGRGLVLIRNFMDEVLFNDRGNEITMIKRQVG